MRHWLWYKANGAFGGAEIMIGGWAAEHGEFTDPASAIETIQKIHADRSQHPDFVGYYAFDCHCESEQGQCPCPHHVCREKYLKDGKLVDKGSFDVYVDDVLIPDSKTRAKIDRTPGATIRVTLKGNLPDGAIVHLESAPSGRGFVSMHQDEAVPLVFSNGVSVPVDLVVPLKGFVGLVRFRPDDESHSSGRSLQVRGW